MIDLNTEVVTSDELTAERFTSEVFHEVAMDYITHLEGVMIVCQRHGIDPDDVNKFILETLKSKIEVESTDLFLLKTKRTNKSIAKSISKRG